MSNLQTTVRRSSAVALGVLLVALMSACSTGSNKSNDATTAEKASVPPPPHVAEAGKLIVCGDASYPPQLYIEGGQTKGYDADIGNAIAATMGVKADLSNVPFSGLLAALAADKCDIIVNSFAITPERLASVSMTYYGQYGGAFLVATGNPKGITSLQAACGKTIGLGVGTDYQPIAEDANNDVCKENPIAITGYPTEVAGVTAVSTGKIDAYITDEPSAVYRASQNKGIEVGGELGNKGDMGIVSSLNNGPMTTAVQQAVQALKTDGKLKDIFHSYNLDAVYPTK